MQLSCIKTVLFSTKAGIPKININFTVKLVIFHENTDIKTFQSDYVRSEKYRTLCGTKFTIPFGKCTDDLCVHFVIRNRDCENKGKLMFSKRQKHLYSCVSAVIACCIFFII